MGDDTKKMAKSLGRTKMFDVHTHKKEDIDVIKIDERKKGAWIAEGKDKEGNQVRKFVPRGTKSF